MARVTLTDVNKIYPNGFHAVKDFNLDIQDKEFMVFVGPSGCGKSTTLRMVAGLEEISGGTCQIGERVVNNVAPKDRDIAMVFQNYALYPHMSVYKNMAFGLKLRKFKRDEIDRRVMNAADILGIKELLERKPKQLSGGQRQRVALGRAIVRDPACFLFDEPLSNLDAKLRVEMRAELKRLHLRLQTTTIYVTHDQEEAMTLGDRICVMKLGITQQVDTALMTYWHPVNRFVASFVGTPPMNFMTGRVIAENDELFFDEGDSKVKVPGWAKNDMGKYVGKSVVFGVRPEVFSITPQGKGENATMRVKINVIEPLGDKMDVYMTTNQNDHIVARINATTAINSGDEIDINVDLDRVHYFEDVEDGKNICLEAEKAHIAQAEVMA